jgi:hypothetical protein
MLNIGTDGRLTPVADSPFPITGFSNVIRVKFFQMIGRGTRLCEDIFAPGVNIKILTALLAVSRNR